ncbi:MAG: hypothetical protein IJN44_01215, partial [Clostridia bacterium]|nr:hypothetical protein [Clostridia bacterium]
GMRLNITILEALTTLIEGLITFISPCVLPMIPVYVLYFAGSSEGKQARRTLARALSFVLGFTALFVLLGVFAGSLGGLLVRYQREVNLICGMIMILFGLHYAGILHITLLDKTVKPESAQMILDGVSSQRKGILWLETSPHVCTITDEKDKIIEAMAAFLRKAEES